MTNSIEEIENNKVIFVIGSNPRENHPIIGAKIKKAKLSGAKLIMADPRKIDMSEVADVFMQLNVGTNIALINSMINVIIREDLYDKDYVENHTEDFELLEEVTKKYTPEYGGKICGVAPSLIEEASRLYASDTASIFYAMGITQHKAGTNGVMSLSNLALLCGNIGKKNSGINPLRGQNNVQGSCDMGALPNVFTGYQSVTNKDIVSKFSKKWGVELSDKTGYILPEMMHRASHGELKCMYIMGENPVISDPDTHHIVESLKALDLLIVQDIFLTETAELADVVLPALSFAEKEGTFTNTERRVQRVREVVKRDGVKNDWEIINDIMLSLGYKHKYSSAEEIMKEIAELTPQYEGITYDLIDKIGVPWPIKKGETKGTPILHMNGPLRGKGRFVPSESELSGEVQSVEYPYLMTSGRNLYHYHTRTMTGKVDGLNEKSSSSYIEIHPNTMKKLGLKEGETVSITSRRGSIVTNIKGSFGILEELFFMPFHFMNGSCNVLTGADHLDPLCGIPELKVTAVKIEKIEKK